MCFLTSLIFLFSATHPPLQCSPSSDLFISGNILVISCFIPRLSHLRLLVPPSLLLASCASTCSFCVFSRPRSVHCPLSPLSSSQSCNAQSTITTCAPHDKSSSPPPLVSSLLSFIFVSSLRLVSSHLLCPFSTLCHPCSSLGLLNLKGQCQCVCVFTASLSSEKERRRVIPMLSLRCSRWSVFHRSCTGEHTRKSVDRPVIKGRGSLHDAVPFVCGRNQGFGTTSSMQRRVSGDCSTPEFLKKTQNWYRNRPCGWPLSHLHFLAVPLPHCAAECLQVGFCHIAAPRTRTTQASRGEPHKTAQSTSMSSLHVDRLERRWRDQYTA